MRYFFGLSALLAVFIAAPASAQGTAQQRSACTDDAYRFCEAQIPDQAAVESCLRRYVGALSPACRAQLVGQAPRKAKRRARRHR
jgi:hypothetical protein